MKLQDTNATQNLPQSGNTFTLLTPGRYIGKITHAEYREYSNRAQDWFAKTLLYVDVLGVPTEEERQPKLATVRAELTIGRLTGQNGALTQPDNSKSLIWGGAQGAAFMLGATGVLWDTNVATSLKGFSFEMLVGRAVVVVVSNGGYIKGGRDYSPADLATMLTNFKGYPVTHGDLQSVVDEWNAAEEARLRDQADEVGAEFGEYSPLKLKNVITQWYPVGDKDIAQYGLVVQQFPPVEGAKLVAFATELDFINSNNAYENNLIAEASSGEPEF